MRTLPLYRSYFNLSRTFFDLFQILFRCSIQLPLASALAYISRYFPSCQVLFFIFSNYFFLSTHCVLGVCSTPKYSPFPQSMIAILAFCTYSLFLISLIFGFQICVAVFYFHQSFAQQIRYKQQYIWHLQAAETTQMCSQYDTTR